MNTKNIFKSTLLAACCTLVAPALFAEVDERCSEEEGRAKGLCQAYLKGVKCDSPEATVAFKKSRVAF